MMALLVVQDRNTEAVQRLWDLAKLIGWFLPECLALGGRSRTLPHGLLIRLEVRHCELRWVMRVHDLNRSQFKYLLTAVVDDDTGEAFFYSESIGKTRTGRLVHIELNGR